MDRVFGQARVTLRGATAGVVAISVTGLVVVSTIEALRHFLAPVVAGASAVWIDYTGAAIAVSDSELRGIAGPVPPGTRSMPMAWAVADGGVAELWSRQALRFALAGQRRFVSVGPAGAHQWAHDQARIAQALSQSRIATAPLEPVRQKSRTRCTPGRMLQDR